MPRGPVAGRATRALRRVVPSIVALVVLATAVAVVAPPAQAAYRPRVVIVVGPSGSNTSDYLGHARAYARASRKLGAVVSEVYTPNATWGRVLAAAQGANVFIYLGHGNGWPSPYRPFQTRTKNGLGLNPAAGQGNTRVRYYGEAAIAGSLRLAPGAVVLLNRLCYASGDPEPGMANPSWSTAVKRVDNYAAGFLRTGASVVLADGHTSLAYELPALLRGDRPITSIWAADPDANGHIRSFDSRRTPGVRTHLDPDHASGGFYRSLVVKRDARTGNVRIQALSGLARRQVAVWSRIGGGTKLANVAHGGRVFVRSAVAHDAGGRTWTPVMTLGGKAGWVAGWLLAYAGSAKVDATLVLRTAPSVNAGRKGIVKVNARVRILDSRKDVFERMWFRVVTPIGRTGWIAGWLTRP